MNAHELLDKIKSNKFLIFGHGFVAKRFAEIIVKKELQHNFMGYIVSNCGGNYDKEIGESIYSKEWIEDKHNLIVCVAVHESLKNEIISDLKKIQSDNEYIWIYPYLFELMLDAPVVQNIWIDVYDIVKKSSIGYYVAVRYLAIEQYLGKCNNGYEIYLKVQSLYSDRYTAYKRLEQFINLIKNWVSSGYDEHFIIKLNRNYEVIDGAHRVSLARYFNVKKVKCNVFQTDVSPLEIHGNKGILSKEILYGGGFTDLEIEQIKLAQYKMEKIYDRKGENTCLKYLI